MYNYLLMSYFNVHPSDDCWPFYFCLIKLYDTFPSGTCCMWVGAQTRDRVIMWKQIAWFFHWSRFPDKLTLRECWFELNANEVQLSGVPYLSLVFKLQWHLYIILNKKQKTTNWRKFYWFRSLITSDKKLYYYLSYSHWNQSTCNRFHKIKMVLTDLR